MMYLHLQEIDADSVNLWTREEADLKLEIKNLMYPPSFQVTAISQNATAPSFVTVQFMLSDASRNDFFIILPLCADTFSSLKSKLCTYIYNII